MSAPAEIKAGDRTVELGNPDKELFPADGISKRDLAGYYVRAAEWMLPHLANRPIHVRRFPDGIDAEGWVQKQAGEHYPDWVETARMAKREGGEVEHVVVSDPATLAYLVGQGAISVHGWLSRVDRPDNPDQLIIDLDPPDGFEQVRKAARIVREVFDELDLPAYLKTTGSRGVHVIAPLDRRAGFDECRELAHGIARVAAAVAPDQLTVEIRKAKRDGRLFVDWLRNGYAQTAVLPYSVRARPGAPVAMPIEWSELGRVDARSFTIGNALRRLPRKRDPWRDMRRRARSVGPASEKLERMLSRIDAG